MTTTTEKHNSFCYKLNYQRENKALIIRTNPKVFNEAVKLFGTINQSYIEYFSQLCGPFTPPYGLKYGYSDAFEIHSHKNWIEFRAQLPGLTKKSENALFSDEFKANNLKARAILGSMSVLLNTVLMVAHENLPCQPGEQMISFPVIMCEPVPSGCGLRCELHPNLIKYVTKMRPSEIEKVTQIMRKAERYMFPMRTYYHSCQLIVQNDNRVHLSVTGDACGLDPDSSFAIPDNYFLTPHNVDSPLQALTLIVGLAELEKIARRLDN